MNTLEKGGECSCIFPPFVIPSKSQTSRANSKQLPPVITADNNLITAHRIGWIIWIYQIIKRTGYHISKAKSVRIGCLATSRSEFSAFRKIVTPEALAIQGVPGTLLFYGIDFADHLRMYHSFGIDVVASHVLPMRSMIKYGKQVVMDINFENRV